MSETDKAKRRAQVLRRLQSGEKVGAVARVRGEQLDRLPVAARKLLHCNQIGPGTTVSVQTIGGGTAGATAQRGLRRRHHRPRHHRHVGSNLHRPRR
jgi:hypothetical protein